MVDKPDQPQEHDQFEEDYFGYCRGLGFLYFYHVREWKEDMRPTFSLNEAFVVVEEVDASHHAHLNVFVEEHELNGRAQMVSLIPPTAIDHGLKQLFGVDQAHVAWEKLRVANSVTATTAL